MASDVPTFSAASGSSSFTRITLLGRPPFCRDEQGSVDNHHVGTPMGSEQRFSPAPAGSSQTGICQRYTQVGTSAVSCCSLTTWLGARGSPAISVSLPRKPRAEESHANLGTRGSNYPPDVPRYMWLCRRETARVDLGLGSGCVTALLLARSSLSRAKPTANTSAARGRRSSFARHCEDRCPM
jgi:hypothetical protein